MRARRWQRCQKPCTVLRGIAPDALMNDHVLKTGQRTLVRNIKQLLRERAQREHEIESRDHAERTAIEAEASSGCARIEHAFVNSTKTAQQKRDAALSQLRASYDQQKSAVEKAYAEDRDSLNQRAAANEREAKKQFQEKVWLAETVFEATHEQPNEAYEQELKIADQLLEETSKLTEAVAGLLRRSRVGAFTAPEQGSEPPPDSGITDDAAVAMDGALDEARSIEKQLKRSRLLSIFRGVKPLLLLITAAAVGAAIDWFLWRDEGAWLLVVALPSAAALALLVLYISARSMAKARWHRFIQTTTLASHLHEARVASAKADRDEKIRTIRETRDREVTEVTERHQSIVQEIRSRRDKRLARVEEKYPARLESLRAEHEAQLAIVEREFAHATSDACDMNDRETAELESNIRKRREAHEAWFSEARQRLEADWKHGSEQAYQLLASIQHASRQIFPAWSADVWETWSPPRAFAPAIPFANVHIDLNDLEGGVPQDSQRLPLPGPERFDVPTTLAFPDQCSLLLVRDGDDGGRSVRVLQNLMMRILTCVPPGKARFTIVDPVGLGQNFAGFMHLADYNDALVGGKIWTEPRHIEQRLTDLTEHMENVIQKYLRNEYETIDEYNEQAGEIAEPYRFLVLADFPTNFNESAMKRLASIVSSGARCGVHTLIAMNSREKLPDGLDLDDLRRLSLVINSDTDKVQWIDDDFGDLPLTLEDPPGEMFITRILNLVGHESIEAGRVEVPFEVIAPQDDEIWSLSTQTEFRVPLGRSGATKLQYLTLGRGTAQHALIAGKTGSGKSTLLHALVTNLALWYSPDEVELYLIDFKKGVEFKTYATHDLPHLRALAIESDREFGVSVLQRIDEELQRRGEQYRQAGVQDLAGFRSAVPNERMPRTLLIVDEFQELFTEDDRLAQDASMLLDRLVRQGRAFGIHVLLGSQTLGGAYSLARSTLGQMAVRVALQCSEADSYLILSDDNAAARLLSRPGEAIYNDSSGQLEGNSPFQIVWLPDDVRERHLKRLDAKKQRGGDPASKIPPAIVFEGNVPADIENNHQLSQLFDDSPEPASETAVWLGEAIAIKDATAARFRRQSGHNLLIVGQREDAAQAILTCAMAGIAAQHPTARISLLDGSVAESPEAVQWSRAASSFQKQLEHGRVRETTSIIQRLSQELEGRQATDEHNAPPVFLLIYGLQRFRDLRHMDDFSYSSDDSPPSIDKQFATLLREGPPFGIHVIAWCDTVNNLNRSLDRQSLREFEMRVLFQMSPTDSSMLIETPHAANLGYHRALYYSEEEGLHEKFRPYAVPSEDWLQETRDRLRMRSHSSAATDSSLD